MCPLSTPSRGADVGDQREGLLASEGRRHSTLRAHVRQSLVTDGGGGGCGGDGVVIVIRIC